MDIHDILAESLPAPPGERASGKASSQAHRVKYSVSTSEGVVSSRPPPKSKPKSVRTNASSSDLAGSFVPSKPLFTPAQAYPIASSRSSTSFLTKRSISSPLLLDLLPAPPPYSKNPHFAPPQSISQMKSDTEDDDRDEDDMIYTSRHSLGSSLNSRQASSSSSSSQSLRSRIFGLVSINGPPRVRHKPICTTPGELCAGETETETDEPSRHLPTARIIPSSGPLVPPNTLEQRLTPLLFEFSRLLSIVPAILGTIYNLYHIYHPPTYNAHNHRPPPERVDFFISALWAILTGYQCLCLTTGLLTRWRLYYPPLSTLVRLLALQGICWPATHLTLTILEHEKRPVITWAVIATTTCMSRSVQIWVTSNLWWEKRDHAKDRDRDRDAAHDAGGGGSSSAVQGHNDVGVSSASVIDLASAALTQAVNATAVKESRRTYWKRWGGGGKWGGRRWDWKEVGVKCVLPAGVVYVIMAWAEQLRREWSVPSC
ncbi:N-glycosylation protein-domain-containing protein [Crassisporium funariophilum]|nr:N-glycosylation protein-domain-containing protein [Crassisporium funariophilum]